MTTSILLRGGTILIHDEKDVVHWRHSDVLIQNNKIVDIGPKIDVSADNAVNVIDCTDTIISPGFIDTHHHLWQSCLKGTHADETLLDYFVSGIIHPNR